ncbi:hypothetical protein [uncultured Oscillibacter sp.]|nr:hypothetical protein [uncultured Oscillibacter sp.]
MPNKDQLQFLPAVFGDQDALERIKNILPQEILDLIKPSRRVYQKVF